MANSSSECENVQEHSLVRKHGMAGFLLGWLSADQKQANQLICGEGKRGCVRQIIGYRMRAACVRPIVLLAHA